LAEFVVIGGGIVGSAVAWGLARRGGDVVLVERDHVACGASGGPGWRGVRANGRDIRELPLAARAYELWPDLDELLGFPTEYRRIGSLQVGEEAIAGLTGGRLSLEARRWSQESAGVPTSILGAGELAERQPGLSAGVRWALYCPLDGVADHGAATRAFAQAAAREGADVREGTEALRVRAQGAGGMVVETEHGRLTAERAVFVLNNWSARSLVKDSFGVDLPIWRIFPQMNFVRPPNGVQIPNLIGHESRPLSIKSVEGLGVMLSGGRTGAWDVETDSSTALPETFEANLADAAAVLPGLEGSEFLFSDTSRSESCCVDGIPIVDRLPADGTVFVGTGWTGHGFAISPAVAECLVEWALSGERPAALAPFSLERMPVLKTGASAVP
jgi:sarcosine oxidase, subunit beta